MKKSVVGCKLSDVKLSYLKKYLKGQFILDLGAGQCYYSDWLAENYPFLKITAVDRLPVNESSFRKFEYFTVDLENVLPFPDQTFDSVIAFDIIEHIEAETQLLSELKRICKKEGLIIGSVPHDDDKFLPDYNLTFYHRTDVTHKRYYVPELITDKFNKLGFKVEIVALHGEVNLQVFSEFFPKGTRFLVKKMIGLFRRVGLVNSQVLKSDLFFVAKRGE